MESSNSIGKKIAIALAVIIALGAIYFLLGDKLFLANSNTEAENNDASEDVMQQIDTTNLGIEDIEVGSGAEAFMGKLVTVHYVGSFEDGTVFDSSVGRGQPFQFIVGAGQVIPGWDAGVKGMKVGGKRMLTIPSDLAYGDAGVTDFTGKEVIPGGVALNLVSSPA